LFHFRHYAIRLMPLLRRYAALRYKMPPGR